MKFYRYLIYRLYTWRLRVKDSLPVLTVVVIISGVHTLLLIFFYQVIITFVPSSRPFITINKWVALAFVLVHMGLFHLLANRKGQWNRYVDEFKNESPRQRKIAGFKVFLFTVGTLILTFVAAIVLSFFYKE